jgi:hypothetical protein
VKVASIFKYSPNTTSKNVGENEMPPKSRPELASKKNPISVGI